VTLSTKLTLDDVRAEKARRRLSEFVRQAWPSLEPAIPYIHGWHIDAVCEHLEAITNGQLRNLIINMPPGHMKSLLVSVCWPVWWWLRAPHKRFLFASYGEHLSIRDSVRCRRLIESPWFQENYGHIFGLTGDQNSKLKFDTDKTGYRIATSTGGRGTGERADVIAADDPHNVIESESDAVRQGVLDWWDGSMSTRDNDPKTCARLVIMQRVHEKDLSGHLLAYGGYEHLCLPAEYEPGRRSVTVLGNYEKRTEAGELLHPERFGRSEIEAMKVPLARFINGVAGQLQQRPAPSEGGLVKRVWWRYWQPEGMDLGPVEVEGVKIDPVTLPDEFERQFDSWDATFKDAKDSDYVVGGEWARVGADIYLLDRVRDRMDFTKTLSAVRSMRYRWKRSTATLIEDTANGPAIVNTLQHEIMGVLPVKVKGSKDARLQSVLPIIAAGNVHLPHPDLYPWVREYIDWMAVFPNGEFDDDVDMTSQALQAMQPAVWHELQTGHKEALNGPPPRNMQEAHNQKLRKRIEEKIKAHNRRSGHGGLPGL
jgi:predicted phage terminase large subunit-like protein